MLDIRDRKVFLETIRQKDITEQDNIVCKGDNLKYSQDIKMNTRIARYLHDNFNIHEFSISYYMNEFCSDGSYRLRSTSWEERMTAISFVDVFGPHIYGMSQETSNNYAFKTILNVVKHKEDNVSPGSKWSNVHRWHIFIYENTVILKWFGRDIDPYMCHDYTFMYRRKNKEEPIDTLYFLTNCYGVDE